MLQSALHRFFVRFSKEFRAGNQRAFELVLFLSLAHVFGLYHPKQLADFLGIGHQSLYHCLKELSLYTLKKMLIRFMVAQAVEELKPILEKSAATQSRAGITISVDNSVIDRLGRLLRCTWSWYSGRAQQVLNGQDLLGIVLTINGRVFPLHLVFVAKQGRAHTDKPSLLIAMLTQLIEEFQKAGIDITAFPITLDSWFASEPLKQQLYEVGFQKIIVAGKGNYVFLINGQKKQAADWKKSLPLQEEQWGLDLPACRVRAQSPTFGALVVFFFQKSRTRCYYLMDFSQRVLRGAEIWQIWKQHHLIESFWKLLTSVFQMKAMRLHSDGLYTGLLIKVFAYLLALRLQETRGVRN